MKKLSKWTSVLLAALGLVAILVGSATYYIFNNSVFPKQGDYQLAGLDAKVNVVVDKDGIPHIHAEQRIDAIRTLGFLHASERMWQMEVLRMAGQGRLSEMFGDKTIGSDIFIKTLDFETAARASVGAMSKDAVELVQAYSDGVNSYLSRNVELYEPLLPPEFIILGHKPEPWQVWHSLVILKIMALTLDHNLDKEIGRMTLAGKGFAPDEIEQIYLYNRRDTPQLMPDLRRIFDFSNNQNASSDRLFDNANSQTIAKPVWDTNVSASNSWVLSGSRTKTGKPLMANDPHLALTTPSTFFLAHLNFQHAYADFNLIGGTLPGTPLFLVGRNDHVSWGLTTTKLDSQDLYVEQIHRNDTSKYRTPNGFEEFKNEEVTVRVNGEKDVKFRRRSTRHGPVLPDSYHKLKNRLPIRTVGALKWTALARDDTTLEGAMDLSMATSVDELVANTAKLVSPMQSIVAADIDGNIGLIAAGRVPIRSPENLIKGRAPVPGWLPEYEWQGFLKHSQLPKILNPESGVLVTANSNWLPAGYEYHITYDWAEDYRQSRAEDIYGNKEQRHDAKSVAGGMGDTRSDALLFFRDIAIQTITPGLHPMVKF